MRRTIFTEVKFIKGDVLYHLLFWLIMYFLHWVNYAFTSHNILEENYQTDGHIVARLTMMVTVPFAYYHTYKLLPQTVGNQYFNFRISMFLYFIFSCSLALFSSFLFDYLYDFHFPFENIFSESNHIPNAYYWGEIKNKSGQNMYWSRNIPESFFNMYLLTGLVYIRKWFNSSEELRQKNEAQSLEIEKMRLIKDTLTQKDILHDMMNSFFAQTDALKDIAEHLDIEDKSKLERIINLQEDIGKLQRFRYSLIKDNEDLVLVEYELKALIWMRNILASKNPNIVFQEDIESIEDGKYLIVPGVLSELLWNAYKHSKKADKSQKVVITLELAVVDDKIKFYIENPIGNVSSKNSSKSGLDLIEKRLKMEYGEGKYSIEIGQNQANNFIVSLQLPIQ